MRPFVERDIPQVAELHRRIFRTRRSVEDRWLDAYRRYFADVFLRAADAGAPRSLVAEHDGRVLGFLGVMPRRMLFEGRPILVAVCSQFVVDSEARGQVGLRLLKQCFQGPQDASVSDEAGDNTRRIWEWCRADTLFGYSLRWIRPLRPVQFGLSFLSRRSSLAPLARASRPGARAVDAAICRFGPEGLRTPRPQGSREELDESTFVASFAEIARGHALRPDYDALSAAWAFEHASDRPGYGALRKMAVRNERGISGWFLYCLSEDRTAEVLQVGARPEAIGQVLDHLFEDAWQQGAVALAGRVDSALLAALSERRAHIYQGGHWTVLHSTNMELRHALHRGDAVLTRLEGEWCLRFP